jgi:alkaline phosphatase
VSTVTAARILAGQRLGLAGEEHELSFEKFDNVALVKTYNTDRQVPDSAGTMTAIVTGHKTRFGHIAVGPAAERGDCVAARGARLTTILELAEDAGVATGLITTTSITHATPAANYAHAPDRNWENPGAMPQEALAAGCTDIARQLLEFDRGDGIEVVFGGGRAHFMGALEPDPEYPAQMGLRADGSEFIERWHRKGKRRYLWNARQFAALDPDDDAKGSVQVLGLFEPSHMRFDAERKRDEAGEPSLEEMTRYAIRRLAASGRPYYLMIEGGRIDHGHHGGNAYRALTDALAFDAAVRAAVDLTDASDTLIMVTADHSHTLTISGYPVRGNPILGKAGSSADEAGSGAPTPPYTTLGYHNGPGYRTPLEDLTSVDTEAMNYRQIAAFPAPSETHGGEDVAAYARGPNAAELRGVMEQNELYRVLHGALFAAAAKVD